MARYVFGSPPYLPGLGECLPDQRVAGSVPTDAKQAHFHFLRSRKLGMSLFVLYKTYVFAPAPLRVHVPPSESTPPPRSVHSSLAREGPAQGDHWHQGGRYDRHRIVYIEITGECV